jgi:nucleoside-diphosphate-sugar epimerase
MTETSVLITGACGEIGQALVQALAKRGGYRIVTSDLAPLPDSIKSLSTEHAQGDLIYKIKTLYDYDFDVIFHLAASLSSKAEIASEEAHRINVEGTMQLLMMAAHRSEKYKKSVRFLFPSSIAAYGMPDLETKNAVGNVKEPEYNFPHTMYGCNKLYCEKLGMYYSKFNGQKHLDENPPHMLDFRSIRFPGLISAFTLPNGGTSDYGPEMLHAAAQDTPYECFVREDTKISFMAMPDAIKSLLMLMDAPRERLNHTVCRAVGRGRRSTPRQRLPARQGRPGAADQRLVEPLLARPRDAILRVRAEHRRCGQRRRHRPRACGAHPADRSR